MSLNNYIKNKENIAQLLALLQNIPCFAHFNRNQQVELLSLMQSIEFKRKNTILEQDQLVDCIYVIVSGKAEVTKRVQTRRKEKMVPVAVLNEGETIGLSDTGFYSKTGKRTATVKALTELNTLRLDITDLNNFLKKHDLENQMLQASEQLLKMKFIKGSLPFSPISVERLKWLLQNIEVKKLKPDTVIFAQGDIGDACYLIKSGLVDITTRDKNNNKQQLATLSAPSLFGEATLITQNRRNATATVVEEAELFVLKHEVLTELLEKEEKVSSMFMNLMIDRSRPEKHLNVSLHHRKSADSTEVAILKNLDNNQYFQLSAEGEYIWDLLDGRHSLQEITLMLSEKFNLFAPDMVAGIISKLARGDFITNVEIESDDHRSEQALWVRGIMAAFDLVQKRLVLPNTDKYLTILYNKIFKYFFYKISVISMLMIGLIGFFVFIKQTNYVIPVFASNPASWWLLLSIIPLSFLELLLHECGHAFAVKYYQKEVHHMGFALSAVGPVAFTDTSDMWLAPRKARMMVNAAGVIVDIFVAGLAAMLLLLVHQPYLQCLIWLLVFYIYIGSFRMLSPLYENDGYFLVMDWVEKHHLRRHAVVWISKKFKQTLKNPKLIIKYKAEIAYWLACIIYLIAVSLLILFVQHVVFTAIGFQPPNPYISLIIPFVVVLFTSLNVIAEIKAESYK